MSGAVFIVGGLLIAAFVIALSVSQGQNVSVYSNYITNLTNDAGITIPVDNISTGIPYLESTNISGDFDASRITAGIFAGDSGDTYQFNSRVTIGSGLEVTNGLMTEFLDLVDDSETPTVFYNHSTGNLYFTPDHCIMGSPDGLAHLCPDDAGGLHVGYGDNPDTHSIYTSTIIQQQINSVEVGRWDAGGLNMTAGNVTITQGYKICLNQKCTKFIWDNGTDIIINNTG